MIRLTTLAHERLAARLRPGELAADATAGNGHDTLFLANAVGDTGRVWAFDIQRSALDATRARLARHGVSGRVTLIHDSNAAFASHLGEYAQGRLAVVMANLGYLPGGDPELITTTEHTLAMLDAAWTALRPGGALSIIAYPGHPGGDRESAAVKARIAALTSAGAPAEIHGDPDSPARRPWLAIAVTPDAPRA